MREYDIKTPDASTAEAYAKRVLQKLGADVGPIVHDTSAPAQSRMELYLKAIIERMGGGGGGGGGTTDYAQLSNKPAINGVELSGELTSELLGLMGKMDVDVDPVDGSGNLITSGAVSKLKKELGEYAKTEAVDTKLSKKQDKLTETQMAAVNSGVTAKVLENKANADLKNVTNAVFKAKMDSCGGATGGGASGAAIADVSSFVSLDAAHPTSDTIGFIANGVLTWTPVFAVSGYQVSGGTVAFTISTASTIVDSSGQRWRVPKKKMEVNNFAMALNVMDMTNAPMISTFKIADSGSSVYTLTVPSNAVGVNLAGVIARVEIPLEPVN